MQGNEVMTFPTCPVVVQVQSPGLHVGISRTAPLSPFPPSLLSLSLFG